MQSIHRGNELTGRRQTCQENPFNTDSETQLTGFKRDQKENHLKPINVDLCRSENREAHHTSEYEVPNLIVRRGQCFLINVEFSREFIADQDSISLKFVTGSRPAQSRGSVVPVSPVDHLVDGQWGFKMSGLKGSLMTLTVSTGSDAIIGRYEMFIDTAHSGQMGQERWRHKHMDDIFLLFNPWHKGDAVYLAQELERSEYVLNETGRLWLGALEKHFVRPWYFGQFDYISLIAAISILDQSEIADRARSNPVTVTRAVCRALNHTERDCGILYASWSGRYEDATAPYAWAGSPSILEEYVRTRKGVKYGQCWTLAAVATTILRTLGIPARCVTCYRAVHDSDYSGPINTHWSVDMRPKTDMDDAIWNYHVWAEAWFTRSDLPQGYDGWQATDPTPMECSEGVMTCGPAPVTAILRGDLHIGFETKYMFAELHGGRVHWQVDTEGNMEAFIGGRPVGGAISTKKVGAIAREDVTSAYRYPEGSSEQKEVVERASRLCGWKYPDLTVTAKEDIEFKLEGGPDKNGDIRITLRMRNTVGEGRIADVYMGALSVFYTGVTADELKRVTSNVLLDPKAENNCMLELKCADYIDKKDCDSHVTAYVMAKIRETGQRFATVQSYCLDRPQLEIKTEGRAVKGQSFNVVVKLTNTLSVPLTEGIISVDGPGMVRADGIKLRKASVSPGEEIRETVTLTARRPGVKELVAVFHCRQICNVGAAAEIDVVKD
ncbi:protein-glutamine gamma-glutamyltransferase k [Plakobranchus ocellatus]|uniref:Protein-glutamine gamma-glutamyltransferase k n=1 Tax=Plakobranchus ocellatus TaxID=259542 RepID=A0AAV4C3H7_9GAST|nr:protein-glutamine gamma-glutamyltransferase k [Plakobranchus ocellatus]